LCHNQVRPHLLSIASMNRDGFGKNIITAQELSDKEINTARLQVGAFINENVDMEPLSLYRGLSKPRMVCPLS